MVKTRNQTGSMTIKKEEEEECKSILLSVNNTENNNKVAKRKEPKNMNRATARGIKVEEDADTKSLLKSPLTYSKMSKKSGFSQEHINQLINYIVNHGMNINTAARKVNVSYDTGLRYYNLYKNDPEKRIPSPLKRFTQNARTYTQKHIENLIRYIINDKMPVTKASAKAEMSYGSGKYYYRRYLDDPGHNIPIARQCQQYTQDQKNKFIGYIVEDKMSIKAAARKANMNVSTGSYYFHKYFKEQHPDMPTPSHITPYNHYTQEYIQEAINHIIDDKMSIAAASRKMNMGATTTTKHYRQHLKDNNMEIPDSFNKKRYTQDEINQFIGYIVDDKLSISAVSKKMNISSTNVGRYYRQYLTDNNMELPVSKYRKRYTQDEINQLIRYIVDDKMSVNAASKKVNMGYSTGRWYYQQYLKDHNLYLPPPKYTVDQKNQLIGYIVDDKMSITAAAKKANFPCATGYKYYQKYLSDKKNKAPI